MIYNVIRIIKRRESCCAKGILKQFDGVALYIFAHIKKRCIKTVLTKLEKSLDNN